MPTPSEKKRSVFGNYQADSPARPDPLGRDSVEPMPGPSLPRPTNLPLQSSIDTAVARSFLYSFIAKAFEDPSSENWALLRQSHSAFIATANSLGGTLASSANNLSAHLKASGYHAFESDYIICFGHTVRGDCPMNEIEYGDIKADPLFQPHRLSDLGAFYAAFGLAVAPDAAERHDHISIELEFMSVLAAKEAYAIEHQEDIEHIEVIRDAQKKFLREHLARWTPAFTRRLARMAGDGLLGAVADFTREFVLLECQRFAVVSGSEDLLLRPVDETSESLCALCGIKNLPPGAAQPE